MRIADREEEDVYGRPWHSPLITARRSLKVGNRPIRDPLFTIRRNSVP